MFRDRRGRVSAAALDVFNQIYMKDGGYDESIDEGDLIENMRKPIFRKKVALDKGGFQFHLGAGEGDGKSTNEWDGNLNYLKFLRLLDLKIQSYGIL